MKEDPHARPTPVRSISFAGGGFRTISYLGQLLYLEKRGMLVKGVTRYYGASLGALIATGMILGETDELGRERLLGGMLEYVCKVFADWGGMWGLCGEVSREVLERALPDDVSSLNGRLFVSVTILWPWPRNELVSTFESKGDLIDALIASSFIPTWTRGIAPLAWWRGLPCLDGGIFDNIPTPKLCGNCDPDRYMYGVLKPGSLAATVAPPSLRREDGHFTCREEQAPLAQVLRPPPGPNVEAAVFEEVKRGYLEARAAVKGHRGL